MKNSPLKNILSAGFILILLALNFHLSSCGGGDKKSVATDSTALPADNSNAAKSNDAAPADPMTDKGVGPVKSVSVSGLDEKMAAKGKSLFESKCSACHKWQKEKYVGPGLLGVTTRRSPEWIMNMIMNPEGMTKEDPIAKDLLATYLTQMASTNPTQDEARSILEYFRQGDGAK